MKSAPPPRGWCRAARPSRYRCRWRRVRRARQSAAGNASDDPLGDRSDIRWVRRGCADYFAIEPHGLATTHLDALCHHFWRGKMYNDFDYTEVDFQGAHKCAIDVAREGVISRGVLMDIPKIRKTEWVEPGEAIYPEDLEAAERDHRVQVGEGDVMLLRTGRFKLRRSQRRPGDLAGLDAGTARVMSQVAA